jgi:hypothetical protein
LNRYPSDQLRPPKETLDEINSIFSLKDVIH